MFMMKRYRFFNQQGVETLITTLLLLGAAALIYSLVQDNIIESGQNISIGMLVGTALYAFVGCIINRLRKRRLSAILGISVFFILCIGLFYSVTLIDFISFFCCMAVVIRRSCRVCGPDGCFRTSNK